MMQLKRIPLFMGGFSLIEVIVIILVSSVAFSMMASYFGTVITDSAVPVNRLKYAMQLKQTAETITQFYRENDSDLTLLKNTLESSPSAFGQNFSIGYNDFVKFESNNDVPVTAGDPANLLKVKITHDITSETLALLFASP